jgi:hypothetical protein
MNEIEEINQDNYMLVLGCSNTTGIGLPLEETWSHKISKHLNLDLINGSAPGSSNDLILINLFRVLSNLKKPKLIIVSWTSVFRKLYWENDTLVFHLPEIFLGRENNYMRGEMKGAFGWGKDGYGTTKWVKSYEEYLFNQKEWYSSFNELKSQVVSLCKMNDVPLWMFTNFEGLERYDDIDQLIFRGNRNTNIYDYARDCAHAGIPLQNETLEHFIKKNICLDR